MSTRGIFGFRKNGIDKLTYNHSDSYPDWLGEQMAKYCACHTIDELNKICDAIVLVDEDSTPTAEQKMECAELGFVDLRVSTGRPDDWYCLLRDAQGEPMAWDKFMKAGYAPLMMEYGSFIKNSLFCEYGYIINLDTNMLEFWEGFQHEPQEGNRYGEEKNDAGYYPCALKLEFPLDGTFEFAVDEMNKACG